MVTVGVTPDDSSSPDTVCTDPGYPKVPVSLDGLDVVSVIPHSSVTHPYIMQMCAVVVRGGARLTCRQTRLACGEGSGGSSHADSAHSSRQTEMHAGHFGEISSELGLLQTRPKRVAAQVPVCYGLDAPY